MKNYQNIHYIEKFKIFGTENPCVRGSIPREGTKTQFVVEIPPQNILYLVVEFRICFDENVDENFSQEKSRKQ